MKAKKRFYAMGQSAQHRFHSLMKASRVLGIDDLPAWAQAAFLHGWFGW